MSRFKTFRIFHFQRDSVMLRILPQVPWGLCFWYDDPKNCLAERVGALVWNTSTAIWTWDRTQGRVSIFMPAANFRPHS